MESEGQLALALRNRSMTLGYQEEKGLCAVCLGLEKLPPESWHSIKNFSEIVVPHHRSLGALFESALKGCHLCNLLVVAWEQNCYLVKDLNGHWIGKSGFDSATLDGCIRLKFQREKQLLKYTGVPIDEVRIRILCGTMPPSWGGLLICDPTIARFQELPRACMPSLCDTNTGSTASIARMKAWLAICTLSHPGCNRVDNDLPQLPTRVVSVGGKQSRISFLVSGAKKRGNYATLSHCWGNSGNRPLTTTERTVKQRKRGIKDEELPKTFRDAVQVCRELDIEYLWIDSLCIIQGQKSQEDWKREAPKMGDVYGNSILTISAAIAATSTEGCFKERDGLILWPCSLPLFGQQFHVSRYPTENEESYGSPYRKADHPIEHRAWVLQEQVLSRRALIFTSNRLVWRCASMSTSEKYPWGIPHGPNISTDNHRLLHCVLNDIVVTDPSKLEIDIYTCWYRMVMDLSSRKLTYDDDKLPSIAGLAKRFAAKTNDTYHAGLWRSDLVTGILWEVIQQSGTVSNRVARAPSWSWASVNGSVGYKGLLSAGCDAIRVPTTPLIEIISVSDPRTYLEHPYGISSKASLQLRGALLPVVQDEHEESGLLLVGHGHRFAGDIDVFSQDNINFGPLEDTLWYCLPVCVRHDSYEMGIRHDPEPYKASWKESLTTGFDEFAKNNKVFCLVVEAVPEIKGTFTRVGCCVIHTRKGAEISRISFQNLEVLTLI
ncbi:heterokaryon incompatibility protein-domain-containing protein [Dendryphion nanum]|uniref:Heterokaryon incompatibility protein-domain-containing protein n=1 Tax=Dendryphion nanum TaxID=256645 RepID=A0A9P9D3V8_9PLEO|nr:heterokaryon incompatibility protein-domain-containing protein [Dendryphion nanum]